MIDVGICRRTGAVFLFLLAVVFLSLPTLTHADVAAPPPMTTRVMQAPVIVHGQVIGFDGKDRMALPYPQSKNKVRYQIAIVRVLDAVRGVKGKKQIRVGMRVPNIRPGAPRLSSYGHWVRLKADSDGILFLKKHHKQDFFVAPHWYDFITSNNNKRFKEQLGQAKKLAKVADNPRRALASKKSATRFLAAAMLITKYRTRPIARKVKTVEIDADVSKRILKTILESDWKTPKPEIRRFEVRLTPVYLFAQLGIGSKDGFHGRTARTPDAYKKAVRDWLRKNLNRYRIKRYVGSAK